MFLFSLPLSAASRILTTLDIPLLLVQFLESNPATRETSGDEVNYLAWSDQWLQHRISAWFSWFNY
jgi:hypothetical protein